MERRENGIKDWGKRAERARRYFRRLRLRKQDRVRKHRRRHRVIDSASSAAPGEKCRNEDFMCLSFQRVGSACLRVTALACVWACATVAFTACRHFPARYYCAPHKICVYALSNVTAQGSVLAIARQGERGGKGWAAGRTAVQGRRKWAPGARRGELCRSDDHLSFGFAAKRHTPRTCTTRALPLGARQRPASNLDAYSSLEAVC